MMNAQGEVTSQNLWSQYDRHVVGITWHDVWHNIRNAIITIITE